MIAVRVGMGNGNLVTFRKNCYGEKKAGNSASLSEAKPGWGLPEDQAKQFPNFAERTLRLFNSTA